MGVKERSDVVTLKRPDDTTQKEEKRKKQQHIFYLTRHRLFAYGYKSA